MFNLIWGKRRPAKLPLLTLIDRSKQEEAITWSIPESYENMHEYGYLAGLGNDDFKKGLLWLKEGNN